MTKMMKIRKVNNLESIENKMMEQTIELFF